MGKLARISELEKEISTLKDQKERLEGFVKIICNVPDDAVLLYTLSGMRTQCEIGKAARYLLSQ